MCECVFSFADTSIASDASDGSHASDASDALNNVGASDALKASDGDIEVVYINL